MMAKTGNMAAVGELTPGSARVAQRPPRLQHDSGVGHGRGQAEDPRSAPDRRNPLKQGVSAEKIRQSYEQALAVAREHGLEESVGPLVAIRLADLERLAGGSPPPVPPAA